MNRQVKNTGWISLVVPALLWSACASAQSFVDPPDKPWQFRTTALGLFFNAESESLDLDVDDSADLAVDVTYFLNQHVAVQVLATFVNTEVKTESPAIAAVAGDESLGSVDLLPPIVTLQYHMLPDEAIQPYVGAGVNYNRFSNESGALSQVGADIDDEIGYVGEVGADFQLRDSLYANLNFKYLTVEADVDTNLPGALGSDELDIDAYIVGAGLGYRF